MTWRIPPIGILPLPPSYLQRTDIFLTAGSFLLLPTSADGDASGEAHKLMKVVINRGSVDMTWRRLRNVQLPTISLLAPTFHICHSSCDSWYLYAQTKLQKYSIVLWVNSKYLGYTHIIFGIISLEKKPQLIYMALSFMNSFFSFIQHVLSCV